MTFVDQLLDPAMPQRHQGNLGRDEDRLDHDEDEDDQQLQDDVAHRPAFSVASPGEDLRVPAGFEAARAGVSETASSTRG